MEEEFYGFKTADLVVKPFLMQHKITADCQAGLIANVYRSPGHKTFYIVPKSSVEPYYRSLGLPEEVIREKLIKLKLLPQAKPTNGLLQMHQQQLSFIPT